VAEAGVSRSSSDVIGSLSEAECRRLLARLTFGRVGITSGGLPLILPVRYLYDNGVIVFRTGAGTKLRAAVSGEVLAFEVDVCDDANGRAWTVLVLGRATVVTTGHEHEGLPTFDPLIDGERNHYVRLQCELVTGEVIETAHS
jgi:nitroimidazol reductase NimA-like FMN-containing flavoprotein (pyridoxamine 5'-phosphate oxidase superfamily)